MNTPTPGPSMDEYRASNAPSGLSEREAALEAALLDVLDRFTAAFPEAETYAPIRKARAVLALAPAREKSEPAPVAQEPSDAVAKAVRVMAAVDEYHEHPNRNTRYAVRAALMDVLTAPASEYRVSAGATTGWSPWFPGDGARFEKSYQVERRAAPTAAPEPEPKKVYADWCIPGAPYFEAMKGASKGAAPAGYTAIRSLNKVPLPAPAQAPINDIQVDRNGKPLPSSAVKASDWQGLDAELASASGEIRGILLTKASERNEEQEARLAVLRKLCIFLGAQRYAALAASTTQPPATGRTE